MTAIGAQTPQNMAALVRGNEVRVRNAKTKQRIAALPQEDGFAMACAVLKRPNGEQQAMTVFHLITAVHRVGPRAAGTVLRRAGIMSTARRIRDLTPRQRDQIASWMDFECERRECDRQERGVAQ